MNEIHHSDESQECAQMRRQFDLYELDMPLEKTAVGFESHFKGCSNCRNWLANWDLVKVSAHKVEAVDVPPFVFDNIMATVNSLAAPQASVKIYSSDLATMLFGFGILVLSFTIFASGSFDESLSWCVSFALLIAFNQLTKAKTSLGVA